VYSVLIDDDADNKFGPNIDSSGARWPSLGEPLVIGKCYPIQWQESRVNLAELARLRFIHGLSHKNLAERYGRTLNAIGNYFQIIRKKDFEIQGLTEEERKKFRWAYKN